MSQRRPLSLIAIVAWSLVVCLGVSAQAGNDVAYIGQPGDLNTATEVQQGSHNNAHIQQSGQNNTATQTQIGESNQAKIKQAGNRGVAI
jgi:hypothetical protein